MIKPLVRSFGDGVKTSFDFRSMKHACVIARIAMAHGIKGGNNDGEYLINDCYEYLTRNRFRKPADYGMAQGHIRIVDGKQLA